MYFEKNYRERGGEREEKNANGSTRDEKRRRFKKGKLVSCELVLQNVGEKARYEIGNESSKIEINKLK